MYGGGEQQLSSDVFTGHEMNYVASSLKNFPKVSESNTTKLKFSVPREVHALEQGLLFVSPSSPFLQGTGFAAPTAQYAMVASPDALLVGNGGFKPLLEVKRACPFIEKDDGRGWVWSPLKLAFGDVDILERHFVQYQVQMAAAHVNPCLLVGWDIDACKVICVPFDLERVVQKM